MVDQISKDAAKISEFFIGSATASFIAFVTVAVVWLDVIALS